jgi:hypothetical protein
VRRPRAFLVLASLTTIALSPAFSLALEEWQPVASEDGIEVSALEVPGRALPKFRGVGIMDANLYEILAVIRDTDQHTRWMHNCSEARLLHRESDTVSYSYNRTNAPWPVSDRDVVVRAEIVVVEPGLEVRVVFRSVGDDLVPPVRGSVRMPHLEGHYKLEALGGGRTRVEYQVDADPGGRLPSWLARRTTRELPLHTLRNLRRRVVETRGRYEAFLKRWDPSRR